ncbi:MAG: hypothetical protein ACI9U2_002370, partial [Bradymonadia bacterium]
SIVGAARAWGIVESRLWLWVAWTPLGMTLGLIATPDVPCLVAWSLALWAVAARRPISVGVCLAAALWSKSTAVVAVPGLLWVMYCQVGLRRTAYMAAVALTIYMPHFAWSWSHDGLPFSFQAGRLGAGRPGGAAPRLGMHLLEAIGGQIGVATPPVIWLAWQAWRRPIDDLDRTLRALGLPVLVFWLLMSGITRIEANWPALAWPATLILIARRPSPIAWRWAAGITACALVGWGVVSRWIPTAGPPRNPARWAACVEGVVPIAARYQEKALLDAADVPTHYLRAQGHRLSEYDRRIEKSQPSCGFVYLASPSALAGRCSGPITADRLCGRGVALCGCVEPTK